MLPLQLRVVALTILLAILVWVVSLVRRQRLSVQDSLAWLLTTIAAVVATAFPQLLAAGSHLLGVQVPSNAFFGAAVVYLGVNVLSLTILASETSGRVRRLSQECALLRARLEERSVAAASGRGDQP